MSEQSSAGSLWRPLDENRPGAALLRVWDGGVWADVSWDEWRYKAERFAGALRAGGIQPGDRVACVLTNSLASCVAALGSWLAGACIVSLPTIARGMAPAAYLSGLRRIVAQAEPELLVADASDARAMANADLGVRVKARQELHERPLGTPSLPAADEPVFVQYSSGSTTEPRGCVLSAAAIAEQLMSLSRALEIDPERDVKVDWLPLSHDMGMFGCLMLTAYWTGTRQVLGTPQRFLTAPQSWFADCAQFGATITCAPNFALELTARVASLIPQTAMRIRRLVVGGELVNAGTISRVTRALGPERLPREAVVPAYGLAEAVLAVTVSSLSQGPRVLEVDRDALANGEIVCCRRSLPSDTTTHVVSVGPPLPGNELEIVDGSQVGEIRVRSASLADGYLARPELSATRFTAAGLLTGDLGFLHSGQLYVTGRVDDLLIAAGRNVYARDIEAAIVAAGGVRPGNCAVVAVGNGREPSFAAVVEPTDTHPGFSVMAQRMNAAARAAAGVGLRECVFLPRGLFPKTPSGKAQRFRCREMAAGDAPALTRRVIL